MKEKKLKILDKGISAGASKKTKKAKKTGKAGKPSEVKPAHATCCKAQIMPLKV